jgi:hypothetical protein
LTSWEINVFSDIRLLNKQSPAVKLNSDSLCAAKEAIQFSSRCLSPFSNSWDEGLQNIWRAYNSVLLFRSPKSELKNKDWTSPKFLHCTYCFGLCPLSQRSEVWNLQDQCRWKENLILYNFSRNRDLWILTFPTSNLARNVWVGRNSMQKRKLSSLLQG